MNENKEELMKWAAAAATSNAGALLSLPVTIQDFGRAVVETAAAADLGIVAPEDLDDDALEERVEQALEQRQKDTTDVWQRLHPNGSQRELLAQTRDLHGVWCDVDPLCPDGPAWTDGQQLELHPYRWQPLLDPDDPLFDPRLELPLDERMIASIDAQGILVPVLVTLDLGRRLDAEPLVVIDGLQRWRCTLEVNRRRLALLATDGNTEQAAALLGIDRSLLKGASNVTDLIRRIPARVVLHEGVFPAIGAANEMRQEQDVMTKAIRLDALQRGGEMSVERAAAHLGLGRRMATYYLALLKLAPALQRKARSGELAFNLARVLCQVDDEGLQRRAFDATKAVGAGEAIAGLRAVLADDERLCPALRAGANLSRPHDAKPGDITTCGITGEWILVETDSATIEREAGPVYVAPGAEEPAPTKPIERIRRVIASRSGGTERDRRLLAAVVALVDGGDVDGEFAWLLGEQPKAGRRKRAAANALPDADRQLDVEAYAAEKSTGELVGEHLARHDLIHVDRPLEEFVADIEGATEKAEAKTKKGKKSAPPRGAAKRTINTRTADGRERYDASIRQALAGAKAPMKIAAICSEAGGTQIQARASLARLINAGAATWQGKGSGTTYSAINTEAVS